MYEKIFLYTVSSIKFSVEIFSFSIVCLYKLWYKDSIYKLEYGVKGYSYTPLIVFLFWLSFCHVLLIDRTFIECSQNKRFMILAFFIFSAKTAKWRHFSTSSLWLKKKAACLLLFFTINSHITHKFIDYICRRRAIPALHPHWVCASTHDSYIVVVVSKINHHLVSFWGILFRVGCPMCVLFFVRVLFQTKNDKPWFLINE